MCFLRETFSSALPESPQTHLHHHHRHHCIVTCRGESVFYPVQPYPEGWFWDSLHMSEWGWWLLPLPANQILSRYSTTSMHNVQHLCTNYIVTTICTNCHKVQHLCTNYNYMHKLQLYAPNAKTAGTHCNFQQKLLFFSSMWRRTSVHNTGAVHTEMQEPFTLKENYEIIEQSKMCCRQIWSTGVLYFERISVMPSCMSVRACVYASENTRAMPDLDMVGFIVLCVLYWSWSIFLDAESRWLVLLL